MPEIQAKICDVMCESLFKKAVLYKEAQLDEMAQTFLEAFASYGLTPTQITIKSTDQAFNYELSFSLFSGSGSFKVSAEKINIYLKNVMTVQHMEVAGDCIAKVYEHVRLPEIITTTITASAQTTLSSSEETQKYLLRYADPAKHVVAAGVIAYILCPNWPQEIKLTIDRSLVYPSGLFLLWSTTFPGQKPSREVLKTVKEAFNDSVTKLDLRWATPS